MTRTRPLFTLRHRMLKFEKWRFEVRRTAFLLIFLAVGASASAAESRLRVLATFAPVFCFAKNVAGDAADVEMLLPPNAEPHNYAISPGDLKKIARADVIVENGLGVESWLDKVLASGANPGVLRLVASAGIETRDANPHVWLDPILAIREVENIRDGLKTRDPAHAGIFDKNAAAFIGRLRVLDAGIRLASERIRDRRLLTLHDAFRYFAARYGFEIVAVIEPFPGREPTPKYVRALRDLILQKNVHAIFAEPQVASRIARSLAVESRVPVAALDPMETGEPGAEFYEQATRANLDALVKALGK